MADWLKTIALKLILVVGGIVLISAAFFTGAVVFVLFKFLPDTLPHIILFVLPAIFALRIYYFRQAERNIIEFGLCLLLVLFILSWGFIFYVAVGGSCTGTGMGGNQVLRICQPNIELFVLAGITALFGLALALFQLSNLSARHRFIGMGVVLVGLFVGSTVIWSAPFLWVRAN